MSNNSKNWAFLVLAFVAGFGVNQMMPNTSCGANNQQWREAANLKRADWSKGMKARMGRMDQAKDRGRPNKEDKRGRGRGKGENGPSK